MRSFIAAAVSRVRGATLLVVALLGTSVLSGQGLATATAAAIYPRADAVLESDVSAGLTGEVGLIAVLAGAIGLIIGLVRHSKQLASRRAAERDSQPVTQPVTQPADAARRSA